MAICRRSFLKASLAVPMAATVPSLFAKALWAAEPGDSVLVLLQLEGGNDGLNTIVPYTDDAYHRARPGLRIPSRQVVALKDGVGLAPALSGLREAWDGGALAVIQGVGYPNPNRSHFTSTDIWQTASLSPKETNTGWLGRTVDGQLAESGRGVPAVQLDPGPLSLALIGERIVVPSIRDARNFRVRGNAGLLERLSDGRGGSDMLRFVRGSAREAYRMAGSLSRALKDVSGADSYPGTPLARRLWQIARLVQSGLSTRVYGVRLGGFDTHARQRTGHEGLLRSVGDAVGAFYKDLKAHGLADRVLVVTYSEFGRRVKENRSLGTDHGAAAPILAVGGRVRGGVHGKHPSLTDLSDGDLIHHTDFRQVYASILDRWLNADPRTILGGDFEPVPFL